MQWLTLLLHSARDTGFDSQLGSLSEWSLNILPVSARVSSGSSGFIPHSKDRAKKITAQEQAFRPSKPAPTMLPD